MAIHAQGSGVPMFPYLFPMGRVTRRCPVCRGMKYLFKRRVSAVSGLVCSYATPCPRCGRPRGKAN